MPTVAINSTGQILPGRVHTLRRTSRTQLPRPARKLIGMTFEAERGPETVQIVGSLKQFESIYGGYNAGQGKGWISLIEKDLFPLACRRACASDAVAGYRSLSNAVPTVIARATATKGVWSATGTPLVVGAAGDADANHWKATFTDPVTGKVWVWDNLNTTAGNDNLATVQGGSPDLPIVLTKIADGRPINGTFAIDTVAGVNGTIADTDFTGTGKGLEQLGAYKSAIYGAVRGVFVAERSSATIRAKLNALAGVKSDRKFIGCGDSAATAGSALRTDVGTYRNELMVYVVNHPVVINPATGLRMTVEPCSTYALLIAQTDAQIHKADSDNTPLLSYIVDLSFNEWGTEPSGGGELDLNVAAGLTSLYVDETGIKFFNDSTTSLSGERGGAAMAIDIELLSKMSAALEPYLNKPWSQENEDGAAGAVRQVLEKSFRDRTGVSYHVGDDGSVDKNRGGYDVDTESVNDETTRANDEFHLLARYRRMGHMTAIVLEHQAGRGLTFRRVA